MADRGIPASAVSFRTGAHGKPEIEGVASDGWRFNLSHAEDQVLVGVARGIEVGVDVEAHRLKTDVVRLAQQVFTPAECAQFEAFSERDRVRAFFRGWTRKEAALKATGDGFTREPRTVHVGLEERGLHEAFEAPGEPFLAGYTLAGLEAPSGFSACACAQGDGCRPRVVRFD